MRHCTTAIQAARKPLPDCVPLSPVDREVNTADNVPYWGWLVLVVPMFNGKQMMVSKASWKSWALPRQRGGRAPFDFHNAFIWRSPVMSRWYSPEPLELSELWQGWSWEQMPSWTAGRKLDGSWFIQMHQLLIVSSCWRQATATEPLSNRGWRNLMLQK